MLTYKEVAEAFQDMNRYAKDSGDSSVSWAIGEIAQKLIDTARAKDPSFDVRVFISDME